MMDATDAADFLATEADQQITDFAARLDINPNNLRLLVAARITEMAEVEDDDEHADRSA